MRPPQTAPKIALASTPARRSILVLFLCAVLAPAATAADGTWSWPVEGEVVTQYENGDDPYAAGQHRGIDIAAPAGEPVVAATAGTVTFAGTVGSAGLTVGIRTEDDRFDTSYLHLESTSVEEGDHLEPGDLVGAVGTSGAGSIDESHLHFGVRVAGEDHAYRNPLNFLGEPAGPAPEPPPVPVVPPPDRGPLPAPAPTPLAPPRPAPLLRPAPVVQPAGRPVLAPTPGLAPRPDARQAPRPLPSPGPARAPAPRPAGAPEGGTSPAGAPDPAPAPSRGPGAAASGTQNDGDALAHAPITTRTDAPVTAAGGFDVGWALALVGVALAGVAMLRPSAGRALVCRAVDAVGGVRRASPHRS